MAEPVIDGATVAWNADGSYNPTCGRCPWVGKTRWKRHEAAQAVRRHVASRRHKARVEELDSDPTAELLRQVFTDEQVEALWEASRRGLGALGAANSKLALALTAIRREGS